MNGNILFIQLLVEKFRNIRNSTSSVYLSSADRLQEPLGFPNVIFIRIWSEESLAWLLCSVRLSNRDLLGSQGLQVLGTPKWGLRALVLGILYMKLLNCDILTF